MSEVWFGSDDLRGHLVAIEEVDPDPKNVRRHPPASIAAITASFTTFGQRKLSVVWRPSPEARLIALAGNGTLEALKGMGWTHLAASEFIGTEAQARAFAIADNKTPEFSEWDDAALAEQMTWLATESTEWTPEAIGFVPEPEPRANTKAKDGKKAKDRESEKTETADPDAFVVGLRVELGDLFALGAHRILCGDSTDPVALARLFPAGERAAFVHSDPPYGLNKAGIANDDLHGSRLDEFQARWWKAARAFLRDNGSAFVWGNPEDLWRWWFGPSSPSASEIVSMRNEIVWSKGDGAGMSSDEMRSWAITTERAIFFMLGEQKFNTNADRFWPGWEPLRAALDGERERAGWTEKDLRPIIGYMGKHYFTRSQWVFPTEKAYLKLQAAGIEKGVFQFAYSDIREIYERAKIEHDTEVKAAFLEGRAFFDNAWDNMEEVWHFPRVQGEERLGHETPKPAALIDRAIRSCCPPGELVFEPFAGTGTTLIAAEGAGRKCYTVDISPEYVATTIGRWEKLTGQKAEKL